MDKPTPDSEPAPEWWICLFGSFGVYRRGQPISTPAGRVTQVLKIVAYHKRLLVDELIELLWPDAEPGVGSRRLRHVLWRLHCACGDLLVRDSSFIRLAPQAATDSASFRQLAERAVRRGIPHEEVVNLAEEALALYTGELLPGDRYEDWAAAPRESMARLQVRLLEVLVADALSDQRTTQALKLLDDLIEADPYEEGYYLQAADLLQSRGNRRQAVAMIERAQQARADLGISAKPAPTKKRG